MKALVYTANQEVTYREEPEPIVADGDALISIESVGICGSDMHAWMGHDARRVPPLILGHEAAGVVEYLEYLQSGKRVMLTNFKAGVAKVNWSSESLLIRSQAAQAFYREHGDHLKKTLPEFKATAMDNGVQAYVSERYLPAVLGRMESQGSAGHGQQFLQSLL